MTDHEQLRQLVALAGTLHFGRAARACHISPSALSRSIQRLEAEVGAPLFERDQRHVALTDAGAALLRHAERVLEDWEQTQRDVRTATGELAGTLRVYCTVTAAQSLLPELLAEFRHRHADIHLELETGYAADALDRLAAGEVDAAVAALPERLPSTLLSHEIGTTPVVFVGPTAPGPVRSVVARRRIDWSSVPLILPARGLARTYADRWLKARGVEPQIYAEVQGHEAILSLVALGCGVGVVPKLVLERSGLGDAVAVVEARPPLTAFRLGVCVRERGLTDPLVRALWASTGRWRAEGS